MISVIALGLGFGYTSSFVNFSSAGNLPDSAEQLKVLSYNLQSVKSIRNKNGTINAAAKTKFIQFLNQEGLPEVLCTQETSSAGLNLIKADLKYPSIIKSKHEGIAIFSNYPIIDKGEIDLKSDESSATIWADLVINDDTIRIYNIHLRTNKISKPAEEMIQDADIQSPKTWHSIRGILANYKNSTILRTRQAKAIKEHASKAQFPTIICGDFNDTPLSYVYNILAKDKLDSFKHRGSGIGTTYAGIIPALRIDYILADERLEIVRHKVLKENYSDHYPISAEIVLP